MTWVNLLKASELYAENGQILGRWRGIKENDGGDKFNYDTL
jgi:hypothetical protein